MTWNGIKIRIYEVIPPIPTTSFDYCAVLGSEWDDGTRYHEFGPSPDIARANLLQTLWESGE